MIRKLLGWPLVAAAALSLAAPGVAAGGETTREVVASGLDHPRGILALHHGLVLIAEAGRGGDGPCVPGAQEVELCLGDSGAITAAWKGHQRRIVTGMPSLGAEDGSEATGPHDVILTRRGKLHIAIGGTETPSDRDTLGPDGAAIGTLVQATWWGAWSIFADLTAFEAAENPDGADVHANPYGLGRAGRATLVADGGANTALRVDGHGNVSLIAALPPQLTPAPPFLGLPPGTEIPMESVPTAIAKGPDGATYVAEFTGFPFTPGASRILRIEDGGAPTVFIDGFTNIIDFDFDHDGGLYVLEIFTNGALSDDPTGALHHVDDAGNRTVVADDLITPTSVSVAWDGDVYVANQSLQVGGGEVLRFSIDD